MDVGFCSSRLDHSYLLCPLGKVKQVGPTGHIPTELSGNGTANRAGGCPDDLGEFVAAVNPGC
jgi:hypothetical protein